jgi:hypothetical protein
VFVEPIQQSNEAWITMFRRIPGNLQETLILGLRTGVEIVLQKMIRLEPDFMIIRGRISGTQDSGRIVMIPYGELSFVTSTRILKDPEVEAIFGQGSPPAVADLPLAPPSDGALPADAATPEPVAEAVPAEPASASDAAKRPEPVSKNALLAKLRDRLKEAK